MKKIVLTLVAMLSMTATFAEGTDKASKAKAATATEDARYEMNINVDALSRTLGLDFDTRRAVSYISDNFSHDMEKVAYANGDDRDKMYKKAINRNLSYMHAVLDGSQYHEYVKLLNTTLNNRGLNK